MKSWLCQKKITFCSKITSAHGVLYVLFFHLHEFIFRVFFQVCTIVSMFEWKMLWFTIVISLIQALTDMLQSSHKKEGFLHCEKSVWLHGWKPNVIPRIIKTDLYEGILEQTSFYTTKYLMSPKRYKKAHASFCNAHVNKPPFGQYMKWMLGFCWQMRGKLLLPIERQGMHMHQKTPSPH